MGSPGVKGRKPKEEGASPSALERSTDLVTQPGWGAADWGVVGVIVALTAAVFGQVWSHEFLNFDDPQFVFANEAVRNFDLTWAFTSTNLTWLPLTWVSHMIDVRLFGMDPGPQHLVSVVLHMVSACLLFVALRRMTAATWPSAFVAVLFAIHPTRAESVAWLAERKDVLSTLFALLALVAWSRRRVWWTTAAMALSLMAKQTYVTLPFVLLLLDYWPLGRLRRPGDLRKLVVEKLPLFGLTIVGSVVAVAGQQDIGGMRSLQASSFGTRVSTAAVAYVRYVANLFFPVRLAVPWPLQDVQPGVALAAGLLLVAITVATLALRRRVPALIVGWLWFVGTLVPLIGLVQIGDQSIADRYTYFSYVGLFVALSWGAMALPVPRRVLAGLGIAMAGTAALLAFRQVSFWKNCDTLFTHTIAVTPPNPIAEYSLGQFLQVSDPDRAVTHLRRAIALANPSVEKMAGSEEFGWYVESHVAMGTALLVKARATPAGAERIKVLEESTRASRRALALKPGVAQAARNLVAAQELAEVDSQRQVDALLDAGTALSRERRYEEAVGQFRHAVELAPRSVATRIYLALGLVQARRNEEAVAELREAKAIDAAKANYYLTRAARLPPDPTNLDTLIAKLR